MHLIFNEVPIIGGYNGFKEEKLSTQTNYYEFEIKIMEKLQFLISKINMKTFIQLL